MALRLQAMRRVLKDTGSIYLHCDPTASHYLKLLMDGIFGRKNFRNEIVWKQYASTGKGSQHSPKSWGNMTNSILYFAKSNAATVRPYRKLRQEEALEKFPKIDRDGRRYNTGTPLFRSPGMGARPNLCYEWRGYVNPYPSGWRLSKERLEEEYHKGNVVITESGRLERRKYEDDYFGEPIGSLWAENELTLTSNSAERLGYPTQKPLALLERIIKASSNEGDTVLDPFCGCGTTMHAAESLGRKWVGIDISKFSTGLVKRRLVDHFRHLSRDDIDIRGTPESPSEARALAQRDKFEFEKWVCGLMGANGMYKNPGERGADGGVDGVVELPVIRAKGNKFESQTEYVIIQVKGGNVAPDAVKALSETVRRLGAIAGVMVCFRDQLGTIENQRSRELWADAYQHYPVIQGFSIEDMLADGKPNLPPTWGYKHGGRTSAPML